MIDLLGKLRPASRATTPVTLPPTSSDAMSRLIADLQYEIVPVPSIEQAMIDLPTNARVSVSCSPTRGLAATLEYVDRLVALGHRPIPHLAARLVEGPDEAVRLAAWLRERELADVFVIAGDAPDPAGVYDGALPFLRDLLDAEPGVSRVGIAGYPDGHATIPDEVIRDQLRAKHALLGEFDVDGWISTQMCFDDTLVRTWLGGVRADGVTLPVRLGVPGVVDRTRLMTMGTRLGIGASLRYLSKNRSTVMHLLAPGGYDPTDMVAAFADDADHLGIEAVHAFTFNAVADTRAWQESVTGQRDVGEFRR